MPFSSRRALCRAPLTHNYKTRITAATRAAIAGLDGDVFGFVRAECCGPVPERLPGSYTASTHFFLNSAMAPTEWAKRTQNVTHFKAAADALGKAYADSLLTVCHTTELPANALLSFTPAETGTLRCSLFPPSSDASKPVCLPSDPGSDAHAQDCTSRSFVFVCSHRSRDARCGYCGPVLVDLLRQALPDSVPASSRVCVAPCSHFGGHVFAGNVLVYTRHGGVCFGCVTPNDVAALVEMLRCDDGVVPASLQSRVRGRVAAVPPAGGPAP